MEWGALGVHDQIGIAGVIELPGKQGAHNRDLVLAGKRVLEIGCGQDTARGRVESAGGEYIGVDAFTDAAADVYCDGARLPFADSSFDVVCMANVLEHLPSPLAGLAEVARVLKDGGILDSSHAFLQSFHGISYAHLSHCGTVMALRGVGLEPRRIVPSRQYGFENQLCTIFFHLNRALPFSPVRFVMRLMRCAVDVYLDGMARVLSWHWRRAGLGYEAAAQRARAWRLVQGCSHTATINVLAQKGAPATGRGVS